MDNNERSPLWGLTAGASLAGGIGYGAYKNRDAFSNVFSFKNRDIIKEATDIAKQSVGFNTFGNAFSPSNVSDTMTLSHLSKSGFNEAASDIKHLTYQSLMSGRQTTHKEAMKAVGLLDKESNIISSYKAAFDVVSKNNGDVNILRSGVLNIGSPERSSLLKNAISSSGEIKGFRRFTSLQGLKDPEATKRFGFIKQYINESIHDKSIKTNWKFANIEDVLNNRVIRTPMAIGTLAGTQINIPLSDSGVTYGGKKLTSRYITRKAYTPEGKKISYSNYYLRTIGEALRSSKDKKGIRSAIQGATGKLVEQFGGKETQGPFSAAIWSSPVMTSGGLAKARLHSLEAVPVGKMSQEGIMDLLGKEKGFWPYTSATPASKGVLSTRDIATGIYGDLGNFMSAEQNPAQFIRSEWGVTEASKKASLARPFEGEFGKHFSRLDRKIQGPMYKKILYGAGEKLSTDPSVYTAPQLFTLYTKPSEALSQMMSAEEGVISRSAADMMEYERIVQKKIMLDKGLKVNKQLYGELEMFQELTGRGLSPEPQMLSKPIGVGEFIGMELGTGKEITTSMEGNVQSVIGAQVTGKDRATVFMREKYRLGEQEPWKFHSEDVKFMAKAADEKRMREVLRASGLDDAIRIGEQEIEAVFSGKLVGRNKTALINQQIEAVSKFLSDNLKHGHLQPNKLITSFLQNPVKALRVSRIMENNMAESEYRIQHNLLKYAQKFKLNEKQLQFTFGLMDPKIAARLETETGTKGFADLVESSKSVIGLSKLRLGAPATFGAGGRGSIEGSGIRLLTMQGPEGMALASELSERMVGKGELGAADKMVRSVIGDISLKDRAKMINKNIPSITDIGSFVQPEGQYVSLGRKFKELGDSPMLYVPGTREAPSLMSPTMARGERINSPIVSELKSLQGLIDKGRATNEELEFAAASLRNTVASSAHAQAYSEGKVIGSKVLTGWQHHFTDHPGVSRISPKTAESMFSDLTKRATTPDQLKFLEEQRSAIMSGENITGAMWRHPTTGPKSAQALQYRIDQNMADNMIAFPAKFGQLKLEGKDAMRIDVSEMVGVKGDFDRDQYVLSAISNRDTSRRLGKKIGNEMTADYSNFLFNHYTMKDTIKDRLSKSEVLNMKTATNEVFQKEILREGYRKHTMAKTATGQVNVALQKLKMGLQYAAPQEYRPIAEAFYHLEEAAIGGKHGVLSSELYGAMSSAVSTGGKAGTRQLEEVVSTLFGPGERTYRGTITDALGNITKHEYSLDPKKISEEMMRGYNMVDKEVDIALQTTAMATGKKVGDTSLNRIAEQYYTRQGGSVDVAQSLMQATSKDTDKFTLEASRLLRRGTVKAKGFLGAVSKMKGPLIGGAAIAAGIMMAAPSTSSISRPVEGVAGGRNMNYDDLGPPSGPGVRPPPPGQNIAPRIYDMGSGKQTTRANIRMRVNDMNSSSRDFMRSARELSAGGSVNIRTRDDRSILDPRSLANKIHERL